MSTLNVSNITDGTTSVGTSYVVNGSAKAWINYKGTATNIIRDSFNISSVTDNTTGDYTNNFTNSMSSADYTITCAMGGDANANEVRVPKNAGILYASNYSYNTVEVNVSIRDVVYIFHTIHGDLA